MYNSIKMSIWLAYAAYLHVISSFSQSTIKRPISMQVRRMYVKQSGTRQCTPLPLRSEKEIKKKLFGKIRFLQLIKRSLRQFLKKGSSLTPLSNRTLPTTDVNAYDTLCIAFNWNNAKCVVLVVTSVTRLFCRFSTSRCLFSSSLTVTLSI